MANFKVLVPLSYPPSREVPAGEIVDDIPAKSVKWLLEQGLIESGDAIAPSAVEDPIPTTPEI